MNTRSTAFLINGGAGRIICSIPALELFAEENPDDNFIVIVEYGLDLFKGHPTLYERCFDFSHKNLFQDKVKHMNVVSPEPYHVWEYYNQQVSISQAFDIAINNKGIRPIHKPTINLSNEELVGSINTLSQIVGGSRCKKTVVFQPFGRGTVLPNSGTSFDIFGKSFFIDDVVKIIIKLQEKFTVILMTEDLINFEQFGHKNLNVAQLTDMTLRKWMGIINLADYFLGCDSVGQHIAYALNTPSTVVLGGTFGINVTYPNCEYFTVIDVGLDRRMYSPIRICHDDVSNLNNEKIMRMPIEKLNQITNSVLSNN